MSRARSAVIGCWITADLLSILGTRLATLAVPWLVLTSTGSATKTGLVAAAELLPMVVAQAMCGPLLDRFGAVRSAVIADVISALAVAVVPLLWVNHLLSLPALMILVAVLGAVRGPSDPAKQTMLPALAGATDQPLERIAGMGGTVERLATTIGLAVGGVVVAAVGGADALLVTAGGFLAGALLTFLVLRPALADHQPAATVERQSYGLELRGGLRGLRSDPVLVGIVIMIAITNAVDQAFSAVLMPAWVVRRGSGAETLGLLYAAFMAAAVGGSLVATAFSRRLPRLPVYFVAFLLAGAPRFLALALGASLPVIVVVLVVAGFAAGFVNPILSAVTLERAPEALRGRVMALIGAASLSLMPLGGLLGGVLVDATTLPLTLVIAGTVYLAVTMMPAVIPSWRDFGRRPDGQTGLQQSRSDTSGATHT